MPAQRTPKTPRAQRKDSLLEYCRALPGATEDIKWGSDLIFSVGGKMFAGFQLPDGQPLGFKVDPAVFDSLVGHDGVVPAPYMAKHSWVSVTDRKQLPVATLKGLLAESHRLVAEKLPKKTRQTLGLIGALGFAFLLWGCAPAPSPPVVKAEPKPVLLPEPVVNHTSAGAQPDQRIEHGELILDVDEATRKLNAQHHAYKVLETRRVPGPFAKPAMTGVPDFALSKSDLDVINPGPGEYVHVMEGGRHGYENLTIGITYTAPGGAPPMHSHKGEEAHVLLKGQKVLYALGDKIFVKEGPYIVNIPPGVPHSFQNLDDEVAELVVIFPTNVWEYDVLDYFPFSTPEAKAMADEARRAR